MTARSPRVAVMGGGISGLAAAFRLRRELGADAEIEVIESNDRMGGVVATRAVGGVAIDVGAEAFIVRRPEVMSLVDELGLTDQVVSPGSYAPAVLAGNSLHPMPRPTLMGVPASADALGDLINDADARAMALEPSRPLRWRVGDDMTVGELVSDRFGSSVTARSVDPLLSGVYSARSEDISLRAALPTLAERLDAGAPSLTLAVASCLPPPAPRQTPVFGALTGGYQTLVTALIDAAGATMSYGEQIATVHRATPGWVVTSTTDAGTRERLVDAVVSALPAQAVADICAEVAPGTSPLARIPTASTAVVVLATAEANTLPHHSGILMATGETVTTTKAFTFSSRKWPHLSDVGMGVVRASFGRIGDPVDALTDDALITAATSDLAKVSEIAGSGPSVVTDAIVQRWPVGLPQYAVGHQDLINAVDASLPDGLALCGSAFNGVGVPACIGRANTAARRISAYVTHAIS